MWLLNFPMKWSLVFAMKFFTASTDSIRNVYVCTVYHSAPCNSVCWQIFVDAILAIFVNHHTSEQWNTIFLKCLWDEAVETDHGSLSWSEMSLLQFNGDARVHYLEYSHFRSLIQYTYIQYVLSLFLRSHLQTVLPMGSIISAKPPFGSPYWHNLFNLEALIDTICLLGSPFRHGLGWQIK